MEKKLKYYLNSDIIMLIILMLNNCFLEKSRENCYLIFSNIIQLLNI